MVRRLVLVVAFAVGVTTGLVGCGSEDSSPNDLLSVDTVPPAAVANLDYHVSATSNPWVELRWSPGFEPDLAGYRVYRFVQPFDPGTPGRDSNRIDAVILVGECTEAFYIDTDVTAGESYRYAVCAFDAAGNESPYTQTVVNVSGPAPRTPAEPRVHQF
jgi:hypothetical protein